MTTMKKGYSKPDIKWLKIEPATIMAASGEEPVGSKSGGVDLGYGGNDDTGDKDPNAKKNSLWYYDDEL